MHYFLTNKQSYMRESKNGKWKTTLSVKENNLNNKKTKINKNLLVIKYFHCINNFLDI